MSAAKEFVPAFYRKLFEKGSISRGRAGRARGDAGSRSEAASQEAPLQDWVVPVLYRQMPESDARFPSLQPDCQGKEGDRLCPRRRIWGTTASLGATGELQQLERAMQHQPQAALLIHGQAGSGKTTLARGFLHRLRSTGGLQGRVFWFNFQEIHSAEYVVNELARELLGLCHGAAHGAEAASAHSETAEGGPSSGLGHLESATGIPGTEVQPQLPQEDLELLAGLLKDLRGGKTKALLTSRKKETNWLPLSICFRVPLGGLEGEELWEYCNAVVRYLGLTLDRDNMTYRRILAKLCGNPLAIRAILLRLQDRTPEDLLRGLDRAFEGQEGGRSTAASRRPTPSSGRASNPGSSPFCR